MNKYKTIVADPPWCYRNKKTGGCMKSGSSSHYPVLTTDEICSLPVSNLSDKNCVLFLWSTVPMLEDGLRVLNSWGFKYKTAIFWRKIMSLGMGFWFRGQVELCLMGIRGKVKAFRCQKSNFIQSKVRLHSQKPEEFFQLIEPIIEYPAIELFAREKRGGWDAWGNGISEEINLKLEVS